MSNDMNSSSSIQSLNTAVLFLVFNRLDTTKQVFEAIRQAKPRRLYIAADGARTNKLGEEDEVKSVRDFILKNIDWKCEVKTLFRNDNLGCKVAVSSAITWFFENEEQGIILEDDCLPTESFFGFCESMLNIYKNDQRISMVTGTNYLVDIRDDVCDEYFFSRHFTIWGWATWKRAWQGYDVEMDAWSSNEIKSSDISYVNADKKIECFYKQTFDYIKNNQMNTWDIQWVFHCFFNYRLSITPSVNLISNLGVDGTHTTGEVTKSHFIKQGEVQLELLKKKNYIYPYMKYDAALNEDNMKTVRMVRSRFVSLLKSLGIHSFARRVKNIF